MAAERTVSPGQRRSLRRFAVAKGPDLVMRSDDGGLLASEEVADVGREMLLESFFVSLLGDVFALFCGREQGVIAASEFGFELAPGAVDLAGQHAALVNIFDAKVVELILEFASEIGTDLGLLEEEGAGCRVGEILLEIHEALVTVAKDVDELAEGCFDFFVIDTFGHGFLFPLIGCGEDVDMVDGRRASFQREARYNRFRSTDERWHTWFFARSTKPRWKV